ncbi:cob(I)yrinic acid a,c-diamide adenosyltransferase [Latilactobacillus graminis]|uniref:Corrinoid adenosyltransferase n=2 Tax=Latilactobacillus graminis TaxID=60519 RepID=A0AA89I0E9_9LACO|nr:cob(I)yrinic acid a,c-diamide adenosyltransferase [Latilactobacillus graminis]KRM22306.1 cob(I)yrinic acid a,c-diamide adenosyltransferase [Latilactobacillus graminis DSM 20719]QFP79519.1 cob(I)yrinic acid a,c-diamide adenosyltransferase [Latilactobacillus graminis]
MKLYTKTGDKGLTRIIGGQKVRKNTARVVAYGGVDELNSYLGVIISDLPDYPALRSELIEIQQILFDCGTDLATPDDSRGYRTDIAYVKWLESKIDQYADVPPVLKEFILPGGVPAAAKLQYCRTIARRVERQVVALQADEPINEVVLIFLNRLSDYLYAIARYVNHAEGEPEMVYRRNKTIFH